jgi:hypothetical protein
LPLSLAAAGLATRFMVGLAVGLAVGVADGFAVGLAPDDGF